MDQWWCGRDACNKLVRDEPQFHEFLAHTLKRWIYRCPFCPHKDVVGKDFVDHLLMAHSVRLTEPKLARFFMTDRCVTFRKLSYCETCGLRNNEGTSWMRVHKETCMGFLESHTPPFDVTRDNIYAWWQVNEAALWWAAYPDLGILPSPEDNATTPTRIETEEYNVGIAGFQQMLTPSPRASWTAAHRWNFECSLIAFTVAAFADVMPRSTARRINRVRVYFDACLAGGVYAVMLNGNQAARMTVRRHENDTITMAQLSRYDVAEGMVINTQGPWHVATGTISFDRPILPGDYHLQLGALRRGAEVWQMSVSEGLFLV